MLFRFLLLLFIFSNIQIAQITKGRKNPGYNGIWFSIGQKHAGMDKYSGGLGTYSAKHTPMAIHSSLVNKTYFVYGGINSDKLSIMIGEFDHNTGLLKQPTEICTKRTNDPHDNPVITICDKGYIFVFVSGRSTVRQGKTYKSTKPFDITKFILIENHEYTYPQIWKLEKYHVNLFTKYTGIRQLFYRISTDCENWGSDIKLASIPVENYKYSGHYCISFCNNEKLALFFNLHPNGKPDLRTNLYYMETEDGVRWKNIQGKDVFLPVTDGTNIQVLNCYKEKNIYLKDVKFDKFGIPVCLYIRSNGYFQGADSEPYEWCITTFKGKKWITEVIANADNNYDTGCLISVKDKLYAVIPSGEKFKYACGGEIEIWEKTGYGWKKINEVTKHSPRSNNYVRAVVNFANPFCFYWADGNPLYKSESRLYFGDLNGNVWMMPDIMDEEYCRPVKMTNKVAKKQNEKSFNPR